MAKVISKEEMQLRKEIAFHSTAFDVAEFPLVLDFIHGNDNACTELNEFREWKNAKKEKEDQKLFDKPLNL
jgi:hypothetical protein